MAKNISVQSIFSEYKNEEDKVTAALLQVLHYGGHKMVCCVFDGIDIPSNDINILPQIKGAGSRPDGFISCDCKYSLYIESKIKPNALKTEHGKKQLEDNKKLSSPNDAQWMIYITPDKEKPAELKCASEIIWINWQTIVERLQGYESSDNIVNFLIAQFCLFVGHIVFPQETINSNRSITSTENMEFGADQRVIIVGGAWGEKVALTYNFYACQEKRYFLPAKYLAFYHKNRIAYVFEIEDTPIESVTLTEGLVGQEYFKKKEPDYNNQPRKFFKLKLHRSFQPVIVNDTKDKNGKQCAFTYNQRYTTYDAIMNARRTSEL